MNLADPFSVGWLDRRAMIVVPEQTTTEPDFEAKMTSVSIVIVSAAVEFGKRI